MQSDEINSKDKKHKEPQTEHGTNWRLVAVKWWKNEWMDEKCYKIKWSIKERRAGTKKIFFSSSFVNEKNEKIKKRRKSSSCGDGNDGKRR